jgi:hypothetical protein
MKMKSGITLIILCALSIGRTHGQTFEGKVVYNNRFTSKMKNLTDEQLQMIVGAQQEYFIKNGNYKSLLNGRAILMQLYSHKDNRLYNLRANSDTLYWFDASKNTDEVKNVEIKQGAETILGKKCDALIVQTQSGTATYFYAPEYKIDTKAYVNHKYNNWDLYVAKAGALPLKTVIENGQFKMESTAIEVTPLKLNSAFFEIDKAVPLKQVGN